MQAACLPVYRTCKRRWHESNKGIKKHRWLIPNSIVPLNDCHFLDEGCRGV